MIPFNDAAAVTVAALVLNTIGVALCLRWYWRARAEDAYHDGHAAGIQTQIARHARAERRRITDQADTMPGVRWRARGIPGPGRAAVVTFAALPAPPPRHAAPPPPAVIPFPEGLPPGLREYAEHVMAAAARWPAAPGGTIPAG
jgi:hypothetical protein